MDSNLCHRLYVATLRSGGFIFETKTSLIPKILRPELVQLYKWVLEYEARAACQFDRNTAIWIARNIVEADL